MEQIALFIDGGYLEKITKSEYDQVEIDFEKFVLWAASGIMPVRVYYYHSPPHLPEPASDKDRRRYTNKQRFFDYLNHLPRFEVKLGRTEIRGRDENGQPVYLQKQVDILLGVDIVWFAMKRRITQAIVVTGDSDFLPALMIAKREGILLRLVHGTHVHRDLKIAADERLRMTQAALDVFRKVA